MIASFPSVRAVLFDWDGTLADTAEASYRCYVRMFGELGIHFDRDVYARTYSPNWYRTFEALGVPADQWPHADSRWLAHFACEEVALIDGARDVLDSLAEQGLHTGIVTSGGRDRVARELELHGITVAEAVYGSDVANKKPHPEALLLCLQKLGMRAEEAVYVGDSPEDIAMAKAAGVTSIAVPGGYPNREALLAAQPDVFVESIRELVRGT